MVSPTRLEKAAVVHQHSGSAICKTHCKSFIDLIGSSFALHHNRIRIPNDYFSFMTSTLRSIGNVASGCVDAGFWLEMPDKHIDQLNEESFKDNTAHSNGIRGLLTYHRGWKPSKPAVFKNLSLLTTMRELSSISPETSH